MATNDLPHVPDLDAASAGPTASGAAASAADIAVGVVTEWRARRIHNSPASRDTAIFNYVNAEIDALIDQIEKALTHG